MNFLVEKYGRKKIISIIHKIATNPEKELFLKIYGKDCDELEKEWLLFRESRESQKSDTTSPYIVETIPSDEKTNVKVDIDSVRVVFNEPMSFGWSFQCVDPRISYEVGEWINAKTFQVKITEKLDPNTTYTIELNTPSTNQLFRDEAGNSLLPYIWTFSTGP